MIQTNQTDGIRGKSPYSDPPAHIRPRTLTRLGPIRAHFDFTVAAWVMEWVGHGYVCKYGFKRRRASANGKFEIPAQRRAFIQWVE